MEYKESGELAVFRKMLLSMHGLHSVILTPEDALAGSNCPGIGFSFSTSRQAGASR